MTTNRYEQVSTPDGDFEAYCAVPDGGSGPGLVVFQEIFGINDNMRGIADRLAARGYVALVPDMFWRLERRFERKDESGFGDALAMVQRLDFATVPMDIAATVAHLRALGECTGKVGAIGFCLGGTLTLAAAIETDIDCGVSYYGSGNNDLLPRLGEVTCPVLFHYGMKDAFIPTEKLQEVELAIQDDPRFTLKLWDAGHAFSNWDAPSMYDEAAATEAWAVTHDFLDRHLQG